MKPFPHTYSVDASADNEGSVLVSSKGLTTLASAAPADFGGPGDQWSPETLLVAAAADCFILTFRAVARAGKLTWRHLDCHAEGVLDRVDRAARFTKITTFAKLYVPVGVDVAHARQVLEKAEANCLIAGSLRCECPLVTEVVVDGSE